MPPAHARRTVRSATGGGRIDALDGIRAVALLIIMGYHFGLGWLQGGFFALDIFFVLSGYLITGLLISEFRRRQRINLSAFWLRRARRLLPALLIVVVAVTVLVRFAEPAGLYPGFKMNALSTLFYFSNWWQIASSSNYFVATGAVSPLTHTWSLAVEEQFYLIWPLLVVAVMGLSRSFARGVRALLVVSVVGAVASALEMALLFSPSANLTRLYFGTDTHAQSIMVGAALACAMTLFQMHRGSEGMAPSARSPVARWCLSLLGLAGFAGMLALTNLQTGTSPFDYRGGFMLSALSAAAVIVAAVSVAGGPVAIVLSRRPLVWLGTISYGAYLWHYPVFIYLDAARTGLGGAALLAVRFATTFALAALSFYLVERPVMYGTFWRSIKAVTPSAALVAATVAVVLGIAPAALAGSPAATISPLPAPDAVAAPTTAPAAPAVPILVFGDSTALTLGISLRYPLEAWKYGADVINVATEGCGIAEGRFVVLNGATAPVTGDCNSDSPPAEQWPGRLQADLVRYRPRVVVLLTGFWEVLDRTDQAGRMTDITDPSYAAYVEGQLERFVSMATAAGSRVVLMTAPYYGVGELPDGASPPEDDGVRVDDYNRLVGAVAAAHPGNVTLVRLNQIVCPDGQFTTTVGDIVVRAPDGVHFPFYQSSEPTTPAPDTLAQVTAFAQWIDPKLYPLILRGVRP